MGIFCPICQSHQAIKENKSLTGGPVTKDNPVVARVLACGHTISGEKHKEYLGRVNQIRAEQFEKMTKIQQETDEKLAAAWSTLQAAGTVEVK